MTTNIWKDDKLQCPKCNIYMKKEEVEVTGFNVLIDFCVECHSYWFDKGELNKYIKTRVIEKDLRKNEGFRAWGKPECPRCGGNMSLKFLEDLEVDQCDTCSGVWLDHGELMELQSKDFETFKERKVKELLSVLKRIGKK
jgi:Zn-finger nucleic acid-binding protein